MAASTLDGTLALRVFDGAVRVSDLAVTDLFGSVPRVRASVTLDRISLEPLTDTFDFGRITGRLSGYVNDLYLQGARPVSFDALLTTPDAASDDDLPRRISQRAVDNLTGLGGAGGTLASTFLGLFENFRYDRLGLGCKLRNGRCQMRGAGVCQAWLLHRQGAGLPRVDVIGYNAEVDFDALVRRLANATRVDAPVVR